MKLSRDDTQMLARLARLPAGAGVLSVYLDIDPATALHHGHVARLMDLLRPLRNEASDRQPAIELEAQRVLSYVREEYTPHGRTLAVFSSRPRRLFRALSLQLPVPSVARFRTQPYLASLWAALEDYPRTCVALLDQEKARVLSVLLGEIESEDSLEDPVPRKQRQGGWSAFKYERDRVTHIAAHYRHVVRALRDQEAALPFDRLVLGGSDESTAAITQMLPENLRERLAGAFHAEMFTESDTVARRAVEVAENAERAEEERLVNEICERALGGGQAALGWPETIQTLEQGRVHILALDAAVQDSDEAERARRLALTTGARIEIVHSPAADLLTAYDGIGAILRY